MDAKDFAAKYNLSDEQVVKFEAYKELLLSENKKYNITAVRDPKEVVPYHFDDSMALCQFIDMSADFVLADVGCGGGFPGIPIKIAYPHFHIILIEVNEKKIGFLRQVIEKLDLRGVTIAQVDWRNFIRSQDRKIDFFLSRASLQPSELVRVFQPSSKNKDATVVYWAASGWEPGPRDVAFVQRVEPYVIGGGLRERKLVFFKKEVDASKTL